MTRDDLEKRIASRNWYHRITLAPGLVTPGREDTARKAGLIQFPADLTGKTVLDVGAYDGYFSFEAERRGAARVLAYDHYPPDASGFNLAKEILGSAVEHRLGSVYEISPETVGEFDVVLFLGVVYHLRHPLLAIQRLHSVCREVMYVESQVTAHRFVGTSAAGEAVDRVLQEAAVAEFFPAAELGNDPSNWWAPTRPCLEAWLRSHGFEPTLVAEWPSHPGGRAAFRCTKVAGPLSPYVLNS